MLKFIGDFKRYDISCQENNVPCLDQNKSLIMSDLNNLFESILKQKYSRGAYSLPCFYNFDHSAYNELVQKGIGFI